MKPGSSAVAFMWEQEPGVSKQQSPVEATKKPAPYWRSLPGAEAVVLSKQQTTTPLVAAEAKTAHHPDRPRVPPPPGGPAGAPAVSPARRSRPRSRSRGGSVRAGDDPFLAAFLACTERGRGSGGQKLLGWAGLRLGMGYGFGLRGFGLSCSKSSCAAVEESVVRLPSIPRPKFTRNDDGGDVRL